MLKKLGVYAMNKTKKRQKKDKIREAVKKKELIRKRKVNDLKNKNPGVAYFPTANANVIYKLMRAEGVKGDYKDFVVIAGNRLVDWNGSYDVNVKEGSSTNTDKIFLINKKDLPKIIGEELSEKICGINKIGK